MNGRNPRSFQKARMVKRKWHFCGPFWRLFRAIEALCNSESTVTDTCTGYGKHARTAELLPCTRTRCSWGAKCLWRMISVFRFSYYVYLFFSDRHLPLSHFPKGLTRDNIVWNKQEICTVNRGYFASFSKVAPFLKVSKYCYEWFQLLNIQI